MKTSFCVTLEAAQLLLNTHTINFITNNLWFQEPALSDSKPPRGVACTTCTQVSHEKVERRSDYQSSCCDLVWKKVSRWKYNSGSSESEICCSSRSFNFRDSPSAHEGEIFDSVTKQTKNSFKISRVVCLIADFGQIENQHTRDRGPKKTFRLRDRERNALPVYEVAALLLAAFWGPLALPRALGIGSIISINENWNTYTAVNDSREPKLFPVSSYLAQRAALEREIRVGLLVICVGRDPAHQHSLVSFFLLPGFGSLVGCPHALVCVCVCVKGTHFIHQLFFFYRTNEKNETRTLKLK